MQTREKVVLEIDWHSTALSALRNRLCRPAIVAVVVVAQGEYTSLRGTRLCRGNKQSEAETR